MSKNFTSITVTGDQLEIREGGGCLAFFGLPFLLAGLFVMSTPYLLATGRMSMEGGGEPEWWMFPFLFLFGAVFAGVGAALVFGRKGIIVDRSRGLIIEWKGLLVPMKRKERSLARFDGVNLKKEDGGDSPDTYPVELQGPTEKPFRVIAPASFEEGRKNAETVARFLNFPLADSISGKKIVREPDRLDESAAQRARRLGEDFIPPPRPLDMRSKIEVSGNGLAIELPGRGIGASALLNLIPLAFIGFFLYQIRWVFSGLSLHAWWLLTAAGSLIVLLRLRKNLGKNSAGDRIFASPDLLRVTPRGGGQKGTQEIPASELEQLELVTYLDIINNTEVRPGPHKPRVQAVPGTPHLPDGRPAPAFLVSLVRKFRPAEIVAVSDKQVVKFGQGLPEDELKYIHAMIKQIMMT